MDPDIFSIVPLDELIQALRHAVVVLYVGDTGRTPLRLLKDDRISKQIIADFLRADDEEEAFSRIRCPLCHWRPSSSSRWSCDCVGTPEPLFDACHTVWNTFSTKGRCPGCGHQWRWTSCLRCHEWSLHNDWYEGGDRHE